MANQQHFNTSSNVPFGIKNQGLTCFINSSIQFLLNFQKDFGTKSNFGAAITEYAKAQTKENLTTIIDLVFSEFSKTFTRGRGGDARILATLILQKIQEKDPLAVADLTLISNTCYACIEEKKNGEKIGCGEVMTGEGSVDRDSKCMFINGPSETDIFDSEFFKKYTERHVEIDLYKGKKGICICKDHNVKRLNRVISYPKFLTMYMNDNSVKFVHPEFFFNDSNGKEICYQTCSVVVSTGGHVVSFVMNESGKWFFCDDSSVTESSFKEVNYYIKNFKIHLLGLKRFY